MYFSGCLTTLMVDASDVQSLAGSGLSTKHSIVWNRSTTIHLDPTQVSTAQNFVLLLCDLFAAVADVHNALQWQDFTRNKIALV